LLNFIYLHLILTCSTNDETINHILARRDYLLVGRLIFMVYQLIIFSTMISINY
jgi:hypothetical protein